MDHSKQIEKVTKQLLATGAWKATLYVSDRRVVRATRRWYRRSGRKQSERIVEVLVSITRPNYQEIAFIKACKRAGEPLPVRKVQLRFRKVGAAAAA